MESKQPIAEQLREFIEDNADKINREDFSTIEFVIVGGRLDGMRIKEYIKAKKSNPGWEKRVKTGTTSKL